MNDGDIYAKSLEPGDVFIVSVCGVRCVAVVNWARQENALKLGARLSIRVGFDLIMPGAPGCLNEQIPDQLTTLEVMSPIILTNYARSKRNERLNKNQG